MDEKKLVEQVRAEELEKATHFHSIIAAKVMMAAAKLDKDLRIEMPVKLEQVGEKGAVGGITSNAQIEAINSYTPEQLAVTAMYTKVEGLGNIATDKIVAEDKETKVLKVINGVKISMPAGIVVDPNGFFKYNEKQYHYARCVRVEDGTPISMTLEQTVVWWHTNGLLPDIAKNPNTYELYAWENLLQGSNKHSFNKNLMAQPIKLIPNGLTNPLSEFAISCARREITHVFPERFRNMDSNIVVREKYIYLQGLGFIEKAPKTDNAGMLEKGFLNMNASVKEGKVVVNPDNEFGGCFSPLGLLSQPGDMARTSFAVLRERAVDKIKTKGIDTNVIMPFGIGTMKKAQILVLLDDLDAKNILNEYFVGEHGCTNNKEAASSKMDILYKGKMQLIYKNMGLNIVSGSLAGIDTSVFYVAGNIWGKTLMPKVKKMSAALYAGIGGIGYTVTSDDYTECSDEVLERLNYDVDHIIELNGIRINAKVLLVYGFEQVDKRSKKVEKHRYFKNMDVMSSVLAQLVLTPHSRENYLSTVSYKAYRRYQNGNYASSQHYGFMNKEEAVRYGAVFGDSVDGIRTKKNSDIKEWNVFEYDWLVNIFNARFLTEGNMKKVFELFTKFIMRDSKSITEEEKNFVGRLNNYRFIRLNDDCIIPMFPKMDSSSIVVFEIKAFLKHIYRSVWTFENRVSELGYSKEQAFKDFARMLGDISEHTKRVAKTEIDYHNCLSAIVHQIVNTRKASADDLNNLNAWSNILDSYTLILVPNSKLKIGQVALPAEVLIWQKGIEGKNKPKQVYGGKFPSSFDFGLLFDVLQGRDAIPGTIEVHPFIIYLVKLVMDFDGDTMVITTDIRDYMKELTVASMMGNNKVPKFEHGYNEVKALKVKESYDKSFDSISEMKEFYKEQCATACASFLIMKEAVGKVTVIVRNLLDLINTAELDLSKTEKDTIRGEVLDLLERKTLKLKHLDKTSLGIIGDVTATSIYDAIASLPQFSLINKYNFTTRIFDIAQLVEDVLYPTTVVDEEEEAF